ncbi:MAG TPA: hypothetical protein VGM93_14675, partial [Acidimicrobiales bacterium]
LDEPGNGLDPIGLAHLRGVLRSFADEGRTVLVSSHQLAEVEGLCDEVAVMVRGRCVAQEAMASERTPADLVVAVGEWSRAMSVLCTAGFDVAVVPDSECQVPGVAELVVRRGADHGEAINRALAAAGLYSSRLTARRTSLEQRFVELVDEPSVAGAWGGA